MMHGQQNIKIEDKCVFCNTLPLVNGFLMDREEMENGCCREEQRKDGEEGWMYG
jgi:hypothetical protein